MERTPSKANSPESQLSPEQPHHETGAETVPHSAELVNEDQEHAKQAEKLDQARAEARTEAKLGAELGSLGAEKSAPVSAHRSTQKKALYRQTLKAAQAQLPRSSRTFSRLIHARGVEAASEALARTVLRPVPLLSAGLVAFVVSTVIYIIGRYQGYGLIGGGWWLVSLASGYSLGLLYDLARWSWQRRRQR